MDNQMKKDHRPEKWIDGKAPNFLSHWAVVPIIIAVFGVLFIIYMGSLLVGGRDKNRGEIEVKNKVVAEAKPDIGKDITEEGEKSGKLGAMPLIESDGDKNVKDIFFDKKANKNDSTNDSTKKDINSFVKMPKDIGTKKSMYPKTFGENPDDMKPLPSPRKIENNAILHKVPILGERKSSLNATQQQQSQQQQYNNNQESASGYIVKGDGQPLFWFDTWLLRIKEVDSRIVFIRNEIKVREDAIMQNRPILEKMYSEKDYQRYNLLVPTYNSIINEYNFYISQDRAWVDYRNRLAYTLNQYVGK